MSNIRRKDLCFAIAFALYGDHLSGRYFYPHL